MIGVIESAQPSQSGKSLNVRVGGKDYQSKNFELQRMAGQEIIFEPSMTNYQGKDYWWINDYQISDRATTPAGQAMETAVTQSPERNDVIYLPMTSNVVAHAIAAGLITTPTELEKWATAAFSAAKSALEVPY